MQLVTPLQATAKKKKASAELEAVGPRSGRVRGEEKSEGQRTEKACSVLLKKGV